MAKYPVRISRVHVVEHDLTPTRLPGLFTQFELRPVPVAHDPSQVTGVIHDTKKGRDVLQLPQFADVSIMREQALLSLRRFLSSVYTKSCPVQPLKGGRK